MTPSPPRPCDIAPVRPRFLSPAGAAFLLASVACGGSSDAVTRSPGAATVAVAPSDSPPVVVVDRTAPRPKPGSSAQVAAPSPSEVPVGADGTCDPFWNVRDRREGDLHVAAEPPPSTDTMAGRLRAHTDGSLGAGSPREWVGPRVPRFVPLHEDTAELHLLETTARGFVAVYRDPYGAGSCDFGGKALNCRVVVTGYERCGKKLWSHDLGKHMSRPDHLEVQDLRVADDILYFNEACQSYSREAGGKCSSLVAFDPAQGKVLWRSQPLVSNNRFLVVGKLIVSGYGFTAEPDALFLVRRSDGKVLSRTSIPSAHEDMSMDGTTLSVSLYPGDQTAHFRIEGADGDAPRLVRQPVVKVPPIGMRL